MNNDRTGVSNIHPDFDGHLERRLRDLSPKEKLLYLSQQMELMHFVRHKVKRVRRDAGGNHPIHPE